MKSTPSCNPGASGKEGVVLMVVVLLWLALNTSLFGKEIKAARNFPANLTMTVEEKKHSVDGPVYAFASELTRVAPPDAKILFLYENVNRFKKTVYYTYPRGITPVNNFSGVKDSEILGHGYLAVYLNEGASGETLSKLDKNRLLARAAGKDNWAIYKVKGGAAPLKAGS